jgi:drug/metabolite transporter (DMT)-like permease
MRDGIKDARTGFSPFLSALVFQRAHRTHLLQGALASIRDLVAVAIILYVSSQFFIFRKIHPGAAVVLGPVLIAVPYSRRRAQQAPVARPS